MPSILGLVPAGQLADRPKTFELEEPFAAALKKVQADAAAKNAIRHPQAARAIARATVARMLRIALHQGIPPPSLAEVEALAAATEQLLPQAQLFAPLVVPGLLPASPVAAAIAADVRSACTC